MKKLNYIFYAFFIFNTASAQFTQTTIISGLNEPVAFDWMPNGNYLITLKTDGKIEVYSPNGTFLNTFYDLSDSIAPTSEGGVLGVCVDPNFSTNHFVYVYYTHDFGNFRIRIIKFTEASNIGTNPILIFDQPRPNASAIHVGGNIRMHPAEPDKLYFTIGDLYGDSIAQLLTNPFGKVLRINIDGSIPTDNPFYDDGNPATGNDDRIWSYGHRNPFDFCFSPVNDSIYCSENGLSTWDEANQIHPGSNYGWNICEGNYLNSSTTTLCNNPAFTPPITEWDSFSSQGSIPAVTGICVYSGTVIPQLNTHLLVAGNNHGTIYNCTLSNPPAYDTVTSNVVWMTPTIASGLTTLKEGTDGCIYAMNGGYTFSGAIIRICPNGMYANEIIPNIAESKIIPNPSSSTAEIRFILNENARLNIFISDLSGRKIVELAERNFPKGNQVLKIDNSNLLAGTYFCNLKASKENKVILMSILR